MKKTPLIASLLLAGFATGLFFLLKTKPQSDLALRLKQRVESTPKRTATPWRQLAESQGDDSLESDEEVFEDSVRELPTRALVQELETIIETSRLESADKLDEGLEIVEELIDRNPDAYSAYKAKLILLLSKEAGYGQAIEEEELEDTLEEMASFEILTDKTLRKEAFLVARTNTELDQIEDSIESLEDEWASVDGELYELELELEAASDEEANLIEEELEELEDLQEEIELELDEFDEQAEGLEEEIEQGILSDSEYLNEDIVEIPLYRALANKEYQRVIEESDALIDAYPDSVAGYFFLVRALEQQGEFDQALDVIESSELSEDRLEELEDRLTQTDDIPPSEYWKRLRFR